VANKLFDDFEVLLEHTFVSRIRPHSLLDLNVDRQQLRLR
jgi:hypothetical protein